MVSRPSPQDLLCLVDAHEGQIATAPVISVLTAISTGRESQRGALTLTEVARGGPRGGRLVGGEVGIPGERAGLQDKVWGQQGRGEGQQAWRLAGAWEGLTGRPQGRATPRGWPGS